MVVSLFPSNQRLVGLTTGFIDREYTSVNIFCQGIVDAKILTQIHARGWVEADLICFREGLVDRGLCPRTRHG